MKPTITPFVPTFRATAYNSAIPAARDGSVPCCLLQIDGQGRIYSSSAISKPDLDGTADFDAWFRQYCEDHGVRLEIFRDNGHGYDAAQARKIAAAAASSEVSLTKAVA